MEESSQDVEVRAQLERAQSIVPDYGVEGKYPDYLFWPYWMLVKAGWATLQELETHYALVDVWMAVDALTIAQSIEALQHKAARDQSSDRS